MWMYLSEDANSYLGPLSNTSSSNLDQGWIIMATNACIFFEFIRQIVFVKFVRFLFYDGDQL